jgi:hypothetical protein
MAANPGRKLQGLVGTSVPYRTGTTGAPDTHKEAICYPLTCGHIIRLMVKPAYRDLLLCVRCDYKTVGVNWDKFEEVA